LSKKETINKVVSDIENGYQGINPDLYKLYADNLNKAASGVLDSEKISDKYFDLQTQIEKNLAKFSAYKAYHATKQTDRQRADKDGVVRTKEAYERAAKSVLNQFNRYQVAEYNTAVARSRTAKQWEDFNKDEISNEMYPNLEWLPSRSTEAREEHRKFYGLVLPKNHEFWNENQPGNLWNCKCDWKETDSEPAEKYPKTKSAAKGLEGNPGKTGEIFTDQATYFSAAKNVNNQVISDILDLKENAFLTQKISENTTLKTHILHGNDELKGNLEVIKAYLKDNNNVKEIELLPIVKKNDIEKRKRFYPQGHEPRGTNKNADAIITFEAGNKWVVDFKAMGGNGGNLKDNLDKAYQQADFAIIKILGEIKNIENINKTAESFMKQHFRFNGVKIYDKNNKLIYNKERE
jgi:hypothetical protein